MTETAERLKNELTTLETSERAAIAHFLISSLDNEDDPDAETAWDAELTRRLEEIKSGRAVGEPAEKVFSELRSRLP